MIPELKTAFCGLPLRTGTIIVGWIMMIEVIMEFLGAVIEFDIMTATVSNTDDESMGNQVIGMAKLFRKMLETSDPDHPLISQAGQDHAKVPSWAEKTHGSLVEFMNSKEISEPAVVGKNFKTFVQIMFTVVFLVVLFVVFVHTLICASLLFGAYKNKPAYILNVLVLSVIGLIFYLLGCYIFFFNENDYTFFAVISTSIIFLINVYFTWVMYSFYKELRRQTYSTLNMPMTAIPGQN